MTRAPLLNFYYAWELFWPRHITYGEVRRAANEDSLA